MCIKFERRYGFSDEACAEIQKNGLPTWPTRVSGDLSGDTVLFHVLQYI